MDTADENNNKRKPLPNDFEPFLRYACQCFDIPYYLDITEVVDRKPSSEKGKTHKSTNSLLIESQLHHFKILDDREIIKITTFYDKTEQLCQLKFSQNNYVPIEILNIIYYIIPFNLTLTTIVINKGLDQHGVYELSRIITKSKITDVILDNNHIPQANYYVLLDCMSSLKYLSLARCNLNDIVVKKLVTRLKKFPLCALNLTSNKITDLGAKLLGNLLRYNRTLVYLNLSGNMLTDEGADFILNSLIEFHLTADEVFAKKCRYLAHLKENFNSNSCLNKPTLKSSVLIKKSSKNIARPSKDLVVNEPFEIKFNDVFDSDHTYLKNGSIYCYGNNILSYLNLSYNNLSYLSLKKICDVFISQITLYRQPRGLIKVCIEGNNMPKACTELDIINRIVSNYIPELKSKEKFGKSSAKTPRSSYPSSY